jgi:hypothetical protein
LDIISDLTEYFGKTTSLEEQFDLFIDKIPPTVRGLFCRPSSAFKDAYLELGNIICSMLYPTKFKIDAFLPEYKLNTTKLSKNVFYLLVDDQLVTEQNKYSLSFLHQSVYELTSQKDILTNMEKIFTIYQHVVYTLLKFHFIFELQIMCFSILKRIYLTFPQLRKQIETLLVITLINLSAFKDDSEKKRMEECRLFIFYLLNEGDIDRNLKVKLRKKVERNRMTFDIRNEEDARDVEFEKLKLADFNLRVGYPYSNEVDAGSEMFRYIEVVEPNSLVYVCFATQTNDITLHLLKYVPHKEVEGIQTFIN